MGGRRSSVVFLIFIFMAVQDLPWGSGSAGSVSVTYSDTQVTGERVVSLSTTDNTELVSRQMTIRLTTGVQSPSGRSVWSPASAFINVLQDAGRGSLVRTYYKIVFSKVEYSSEGATGLFTEL